MGARNKAYQWGKTLLKLILVLGGIYLIAYLFYWLLDKGFPGFNLQDTPARDTVCGLQPGLEEPCDHGYDFGASLVKSFAHHVSSNCRSIAYPTGEQLYPGCEPYYGPDNNATVNAACLNGLVAGANTEREFQVQRCLHEAKRDGRAADAAAVGMAVTFLGIAGYKALGAGLNAMEENPRVAAYLARFGIHTRDSQQSTSSASSTSSSQTKKSPLNNQENEIFTYSSL